MAVLYFSIPMPSGKRKANGIFSFCQNTKWDREESYFERYYRNYSSPWFPEIKMNCHAFVSINCMSAGHTSRLNRDLTLCPWLNAKLGMGYKWRNISSGIVNCMRTNGKQ
jgi:hypothetical protein